MWLKQNFYYEQPSVVFRNELLLEVLSRDGQSRMFSTLKSINSLSMNELGVPLMQIDAEDTD